MDVIAFSMHLLSAYYMPLSWNTSFIQQIFIGNCVPCEELWTVKRIDGTIPVLEELTLIYQRAKTGIQIVQTQSSKSRYTGDAVRVQSARNHSVWQGWVVGCDIGKTSWRRQDVSLTLKAYITSMGMISKGHSRQRKQPVRLANHRLMYLRLQCPTSQASPADASWGYLRLLCGQPVSPAQLSTELCSPFPD